MMSTKLVVLAALLSAVAFAAPRQVHEVEDVLVQTDASVAASKVASLKKQFAAVEAQLKAGVTPGVADTITKLVAMIDDEIKPAIEEAHAEDQREMEAQYKGLVDLNSAYAAQRDALLDDAAEIRAKSNQFNVDVAEWKQATEDYTLASEVYVSTYNNMSDTCCQKDNAGVLDVVYTPAYYACDFTNDKTADNCVSDADASITSYTEDHFAAGKAKYDDLFTRCNNLKADFELATTDLANKDEACDGKEADAKNLEDEIASDRATFDPMWADSVSFYDGNWTADLAAFDATIARVHHDEADRHAEWKATQEIRCMLKAYQRSGTFDQAQIDACNHDVSMMHITNNYPTAPAREHSDIPAWVVHDSYAAFEKVCHPENAPVLPAFHCEVASPKPFPSCQNHVLN
jgi:hypothetical protein